MNDAVIRPLSADDFTGWLPLWDANNRGLVGEAVTTETWARLTGPGWPVHGLGAWIGGELAGILHYVLHPTTGNIKNVCYMQDLYVAPDHRRKGIGRALVLELAAIGKREGWARIYWLAESNNPAAQALYKTLGVRLDFTLHVLPLGA